MISRKIKREHKRQPEKLSQRVLAKVRIQKSLQLQVSEDMAVDSRLRKELPKILFARPPPQLSLKKATPPQIVLGTGLGFRLVETNRPQRHLYGEN